MTASAGSVCVHSTPGEVFSGSGLILNCDYCFIVFVMNTDGTARKRGRPPASAAAANLQERHITMKIPVEVYKAVRHAAVERDLKNRDIWLEAVRVYLKIPEKTRQQMSATG
jgi:hypothetical protein